MPLWLQLLIQLRNRRPRPVRPATLARALDVTPAILTRELAILARHGCTVLTDATGRLALPPDTPLFAPELQAALRGHLVSRSVQVHPEVQSTQDLVRKEAARTDVGGLVVFAESQRQGRGRFGRTWVSPPGQNLLFSILLRLPRVQPSPSLVTITASVALCECLFEDLNLPSQIRWPNDILLADRKVAGILVERTAPRATPPAYLVGIGINVNLAPPAMDTATSISELLGAPMDRTTLALNVLRRLEHWYQLLDDRDEDEIAEHWRRHSSTLGRRVTLLSRGKTFTGRVLDISPAEGLTIQMDDSLPMTFRPEQTTLVP